MARFLNGPLPQTQPFFCPFLRVDRATTSPGQFFASVGEIIDHFESWKKKAVWWRIIDLLLIPGLENPADLPTRGLASPHDIIQGMFWKLGNQTETLLF